MLSTPLFKKELRSTWPLVLGVTALMAMYVTVVLSMYEPELGSILADFEQAFPDLMAAFGMSGAGQTSLTEYASSYLFGFIMLLFPIVFSVVAANRLVARYVDSGSMACLLASPNSRRRIIATQGLFLWLCNAAIIAVLGGIGIAYCAAAFPGELDVPGYILLHLGVLCLHTFISGVAFLASCLCNETRLSYTISAAVPLAGYLVQMIANFGGRYENLKYATFFTLFSPERILAREGMAYLMALGLFLGGAACYLLGSWRFCKRNLPL